MLHHEIYIKKVKFSLEELNERLQKVREMGEKEISAGRFGLLRESLIKLHTSDQEKKKPVQKISVLVDMGEISNYSSHPPKEVLVEKASATFSSMVYFHPDHMSSAEKQKLELKKVRDKFKISESDCGSARVQGMGQKNITFFLHSFQCYVLCIFVNCAFYTDLICPFSADYAINSIRKLRKKTLIRIL
ncbi:hypothetical protein Hanom_Chr09g00802011 [Helianthus anomalus]